MTTHLLDHLKDWRIAAGVAVGLCFAIALTYVLLKRLVLLGIAGVRGVATRARDIGEGVRDIAKRQWVDARHARRLRRAERSDRLPRWWERDPNAPEPAEPESTKATIAKGFDKVLARMEQNRQEQAVRIIHLENRLAAFAPAALGAYREQCDLHHDDTCDALDEVEHFFKAGLAAFEKAATGARDIRRSNTALRVLHHDFVNTAVGNDLLKKTPAAIVAVPAATQAPEPVASSEVPVETKSEPPPAS